MIECRQGRLTEAERHLQEALAMAQERHDREQVRHALIWLGEAACLAGDYEASYRFAQRSLVIARELNAPVDIAVHLSNLGWSATLRGAYAEAKEYCQESLAIFDQVGSHPAFRVSALLNLGHATGLLGEELASKRSYCAGLALAWNLRQIPASLEAIAGLARFVAADGDLERAVERLSLATHHPGSNSGIRMVAELLLDELRAELAEDRFAAAVERGKTLELEAVVAELLAVCEPEASAASEAERAASPLAEPLSEREMEILRLVARGRSNRQIAAELYLALGTVKTHLHNICGKLEAHNRTEAVARAQELGIL
jgi:ATP/maltotriose-dependent transcriptional regulator MalT